jgi:hypothetical protein
MYLLINTFDNDRVLSRHRTLRAAALENDRVQRETKRSPGQSKYFGQSVYIPTKVVFEQSPGLVTELTDDEKEEYSKLMYQMVHGN